MDKRKILWSASLIVALMNVPLASAQDDRRDDRHYDRRDDGRHDRRDEDGSIVGIDARAPDRDFERCTRRSPTRAAACAS